MIVALITTLIFANVAHAAPGINKTISFQGRLTSNSGAVVPDGHYNMEFKLYQDGTGTAVGNPGGSLKWTETYINNGADNGVEVRNGFFSVTLGSVNPFGTSVDWNQDTLWLSMNVAGKATTCTTFGTSPCVADSEMLPMKRITSTPFSLNSGAVGGKTANDLVQLGQGTQTDASNNSSIFFNKTGSGNLVQLQNTAADVFTVGNAGDLLLGSNANKTISVADAGINTAGSSLSVLAGGGGTGVGSPGGDLVLQAGAAGGTDGSGGNISIDAGARSGSGSGGSIAIGTTNASSITIGSTDLASSQSISIGANNTAGSASDITIGAGGSAASGSTTIQSKNDVTVKTNGTTRATFSDTSNTLYLGKGKTDAAPDGFTIQGTDSSSDGLTGGSLSLQGGNATTGDTNGGDLILSGGSGSGIGASGQVVLGASTFSTTTQDANCYTNGAAVASSCTITASSVNKSSAVMVGFTTADQTATLPDPSTTTAGRVMYIMSAAGSEDFTLSINGGGAANQITMRQNTTATVMWNGADWTLVNTSNTPTLQAATDSNGTRSVQVGSSSGLTVFTLDEAASAPSADNTLLGSMYYDTGLGKVQCFEADGWGACGSSPDSFVTISPEYTNAVMNGADIGTISSDLCSDTLNINDGSSSQPTICGTNETYNFYDWTSSESTDQTRSIFVTYQLPSSFKNFVSGSTSLMGRTDSTNSDVTYQVYRDDSTGLTSCGSAVSVSSGAKTSWQKATATSTADPSTCNFSAGDSVLFRINLSANSDANAYVSNLNFAFSNK